MRSLLLLLLLALAGAGCGRRVTPVEDGNRRQILHLGNFADPSDLDPHTNLGVPESRILNALFEGLTTLDPKTLEPIPAAAERWEKSADSRTWRFFLRRDGKWSNGDPVTAEDFVWSVKRMLTPSVASGYANMTFAIANAKEYQTKVITDFSQVGVKALDPYTLEFSLKDPTPAWPSICTIYVLFPVHRATLEKFGGDKNRSSSWTRAGNHVSNGPFLLKDWRIGTVVTVAANPHYHSAAEVRLREIRFYPMDSADTEERMFRAGQLHATAEVPLAKLDGYRAKDPHLVRITPYFGTYYFDLNNSRPPLNDVRVRRALALTIDRTAICEQISRGGQTPAYSFVFPGVAGYQLGARLEGSAEEARQLLAEAGFPGGKGFPQLELLFNTSEAHRPIAEAMQQMWKRELGIDIRLANQEWKVYLNARRTGDYDIARAGWIAFFPDPDQFAHLLHSKSGNNYTRWGNADYDRILEESQRTPTDEERFKLIQQLDAIFVREVPLIPLYFYTRIFLLRPEVKGWPPNAQDFRRYRDIYLEAPAGPAK